MAEAGDHEEKTHLSGLLQRVAAAEKIVISRSGQPVAKLVSVDRRAARVLGRDGGRLEVPVDFDTPLPNAELEAFDA